MICFIIIALILPIGVGALYGMKKSEQSTVGNSTQTGPIDVGLSLSESKIECNIGATKVIAALTAVESEAYIIQWDSGDKNVATVVRDGNSQKTGIITAIGEGTTTITANVIDKNQFKIIASASCEITVIDSSISFSQSEVIISLDEGNTATITAKAPDDGEITWSSEDESIASVVGGVITAHKPGQVYIVAKSGSVEGKILVKIYNSVFKLEEVKIVAAGESASVQFSGTISEGAVWTSSDERIVSVDQNGVITGVKLGMATIKVRSAVDDLESSCVVVVKSGSDEAVQLESGKKAAAAANPGSWYFPLRVR